MLEMFNDECVEDKEFNLRKLATQHNPLAKSQHHTHYTYMVEKRESASSCLGMVCVSVCVITDCYYLCGVSCFDDASFVQHHSKKPQQHHHGTYASAI